MRPRRDGAGVAFTNVGGRPLRLRSTSRALRERQRRAVMKFAIVALLTFPPFSSAMGGIKAQRLSGRT